MRGTKDRFRTAAALPLLILTASCVPPADTPAPTPPPVASPAPTPAPVPRPSAPVRSDFTFRGVPEQGGVLIGQVPGDTRTLTLDGKAVPVAADGSFLIAFDRDAETGQHLVATLADGRAVERYLAVHP